MIKARASQAGLVAVPIVLLLLAQVISSSRHAPARPLCGWPERGSNRNTTASAQVPQPVPTAVGVAIGASSPSYAHEPRRLPGALSALPTPSVQPVVFNDTDPLPAPDIRSALSKLPDTSTSPQLAGPDPVQLPQTSQLAISPGLRQPVPAKFAGYGGWDNMMGRPAPTPPEPTDVLTPYAPNGMHHVARRENIQTDTPAQAAPQGASPAPATQGPALSGPAVAAPAAQPEPAKTQAPATENLPSPTAEKPSATPSQSTTAAAAPEQSDKPAKSPSDAEGTKPADTPKAIVPDTVEEDKTAEQPASPAVQPRAAAPAPRCPCDKKPWALPQPDLLKRHGIMMGGWIQQGLTFNGSSPNDGFNGPVATNDLSNAYQLNQLWLFFNKAINTEDRFIDVGGRFDMIFGSDFRYGVNYGLEDHINSLDKYYGLAIPQLYGEVGIGDLSIKLGHFATMLSYEQVPAVANFFYSHAYAMGYSYPLLVTGAIGNYRVNENLSINAGFHRGAMMWEDNNDKLDFIGGAMWTSQSKKTSLAYEISVGPEDPAGDLTRVCNSVIFQHHLGRRLQYVCEYTFGQEEGTSVFGGDANWSGLNQYLIYTINPHWSAGMRFEWFDDADGSRVAGVGNLVPGHGWAGLPGFAGDFYELTMGVNWRPKANMVLRPEVRWDWYDGTTNLIGQQPFDDGNSNNQFLFATDLIITF